MKNLDHLLQLPNPWHGSLVAEQPNSLSTGFEDLDALLPERGWAQAALTELLIPGEGIGALQLVLPALARLSHEPRWIAWVAPPYMPYGPALEAAGVNLARLLRVYPRAGVDGLTTVEACLRAGTCSAVLAWPVAGELQALRRLQRAAAQGNSWGVLFRPHRYALLASPVSQRVHVAGTADGVSVAQLNTRDDGEPVELSFDRLLQPRAGYRSC